MFYDCFFTIGKAFIILVSFYLFLVSFFCFFVFIFVYSCRLLLLIHKFLAKINIKFCEWINSNFPLEINIFRSKEYIFPEIHPIGCVKQNKENLCGVCKMFDISIVGICGHCLCYNCSYYIFDNDKKCPTCRFEWKKLRKIYIN